jgi:hypothetical protein
MVGSLVLIPLLELPNQRKGIGTMLYNVRKNLAIRMNLTYTQE